jgi:GT2 family glycosyltransferase
MRPPEETAPPRLSVIVVSYNCRGLLLRCLQTVEAERRHIPLELILVDNASSDGTVEEVRRLHPWVRLVAADSNLGFARSNNDALRMARGEHVLLLNPDTEVREGSLAAAVERLEADPGIGMLGVKLVTPDGGLDHACKRGFPTPSSSLWHFLGLSRARPHSPRFAAYTAGHIGPDEESPVDAVNGAFMLVRRQALDEVGLLDERFWMYMEDLDWCYRFWERGWRVLYWPGAEVVHVKGGSSTKLRSWRANRAFHHGMWMFYAKHYARRRSPVVTAAVWLGVWAKLSVSAARSWTLRRMRPVRA